MQAADRMSVHTERLISRCLHGVHTQQPTRKAWITTACPPPRTECPSRYIIFASDFPPRIARDRTAYYYTRVVRLVVLFSIPLNLIAPLPSTRRSGRSSGYRGKKTDGIGDPSGRLPESAGHSRYAASCHGPARLVPAHQSKGHVAFRGVTFTYPSSPAVLRDVSFRPERCGEIDDRQSADEVSRPQCVRRAT